MFEETTRALRQVEGETTVSFLLGDDEEGHFVRECPSAECLFQFKALNEDWKDKVRDEEVFCPNCDYTSPSGSWLTPEQLTHAREAALAQLKGAIAGVLKKDADGWNRRRPRNSFISLTMKVDSKPQHVPRPPAPPELMRLNIACPACACRFAVVGAACRRPECGHNAADRPFELTVAGIHQSLGAVEIVMPTIAEPR